MTILRQDITRRRLLMLAGAAATANAKRADIKGYQLWRALARNLRPRQLDAQIRSVNNQPFGNLNHLDAGQEAKKR